MITAYLAAEGFIEQLEEELHRAGAVVRRRHERLLMCDGPAIAAAWAANIWHDCVELPVASIGGAAQALRDIQRNWAMYAPLHHRRRASRCSLGSARPITVGFSAGSFCSHPTHLRLRGRRCHLRRGPAT